MLKCNSHFFPNTSPCRCILFPLTTGVSISVMLLDAKIPYSSDQWEIQLQNSNWDSAFWYHSHRVVSASPRLRKLCLLCVSFVWRTRQNSPKNVKQEMKQSKANMSWLRVCITTNNKPQSLQLTSRCPAVQKLPANAGGHEFVPCLERIPYALWQLSTMQSSA